MSVAENVEIVRELVESFQRGDHERAFELYDSEIEWDTTAVAPLFPDQAGVYRGHDGVRSYWRVWLAAWRDLEFEIEKVLAAGDEVVALFRNQRQQGRHSGIETRIDPFGMVFTLRAGTVVRARTFPDQESALKAAGLRE